MLGSIQRPAVSFSARPGASPMLGTYGTPSSRLPSSRLPMAPMNIPTPSLRQPSASPFVKNQASHFGSDSSRSIRENDNEKRSEQDDFEGVIELEEEKSYNGPVFGLIILCLIT